MKRGEFLKTKRISLNEVQNDNFKKLYDFLFTDKFIHMSNDAKILYSLMRDRVSLSVKNVEKGEKYWVDEKGDIFIHATTKDIQKLLNCSDKTATKAKKELIKFGLIEDVRRGYNKPNKIYVLNVDYLESVESVENSWNRKNYDIGIVKNTIWESEILRSNQNNINKTNINKTNNNNNKVKEIPKINNIKDEDVNYIKSKIEHTTKNSIAYKAVITLLETKDRLIIEKYIDNYNKFKVSKHNPVGFLIKAITNEYAIPKEEVNQYNQKPIQSTNFEQRTYDDEYFDNLYDNFKD